MKMGQLLIICRKMSVRNVMCNIILIKFIFHTHLY